MGSDPRRGRRRGRHRIHAAHRDHDVCHARTEAGDYVDAKVWKAAPKALKESAERCGENPQAPFWEGIFKTVMDEAVPK